MAIPARRAAEHPSLAELVGRHGSVLRACEVAAEREGAGSGGASIMPPPSSLARVMSLPMPDDARRVVRRLALEQPTWNQIQLANALLRLGLALEPPQVQGLLLRERLSSVRARADEVARLARRLGLDLGREEVLRLQRAWFAGKLSDRDPRAAYGYQDTYSIGTMEQLGALYLQTFVDVGSGRVFTALHRERSPRAAGELLERQVLPYYEAQGRRLRCVFTDRGTEYCGYVRRHRYELFLYCAGIEHRWLEGENPQQNPVCDRVHALVHGDLLCPLLLRRGPLDVPAIRQALRDWVRSYNAARALQDFSGLKVPSFGARLSGAAVSASSEPVPWGRSSQGVRRRAHTRQDGRDLNTATCFASRTSASVPARRGLSWP